MTSSASAKPFMPQAGAVKFTMLLAGVVLLLMGFGLVMRAAQANLIALDTVLFYQLLTAHGAGMVGTAGLTGAAIMWFFVGRYVPLVRGVYWAFLILFLIGVLLILGAVFIGGYGGAWTFLFPLPANSGGYGALTPPPLSCWAISRSGLRSCCCILKSVASSSPDMAASAVPWDGRSLLAEALPKMHRLLL